MIPVTIAKVEGQTFVGANVQIDGGSAYVNCKFVNCNLVFTGIGTVQVQNSIFENCPLTFAGPAANTISFLTSMYASGSEQMVEEVFRAIRTGAVKKPVPVPTPPHSPHGVQ
jgi:hypothetical protein